MYNNMYMYMYIHVHVYVHVVHALLSKMTVLAPNVHMYMYIHVLDSLYTHNTMYTICTCTTIKKSSSKQREPTKDSGVPCHNYIIGMYPISPHTMYMYIEISGDMNIPYS